MTDLKVVARGLRFPEGPVAMADGSVVVVEVEGGTVSRVTPRAKLSSFPSAEAAPTDWPLVRTGPYTLQ